MKGMKRENVKTKTDRSIHSEGERKSKIVRRMTKMK